jgi:hypothetical protein
MLKKFFGVGLLEEVGDCLVIKNDSADSNVEAIQPESFMVVMSDTVSNPGTMMIHLHIAFVARAAMMLSFSFPHTAFFALFVCVWTGPLWNVFDRGVKLGS